MVPGLYRRVLPVVCRREVSERHPDRALRDEHGPQYLAEEVQMTAQADQLAAERLAAGTPIETWWYDMPPGLPAPLDQLGHGPSPRNMTISPDDRVDASN